MRTNRGSSPASRPLHQGSSLGKPPHPLTAGQRHSAEGSNVDVKDHLRVGAQRAHGDVLLRPVRSPPRRVRPSGHGYSSKGEATRVIMSARLSPPCGATDGSRNQASSPDGSSRSDVAQAQAGPLTEITVAQLRNHARRVRQGARQSSAQACLGTARTMTRRDRLSCWNSPGSGSPGWPNTNCTRFRRCGVGDHEQPLRHQLWPGRLSLAGVICHAMVRPTSRETNSAT